MTYGQINYQQKLGNSNLTIAEAGCFVTADCNLLEDVGIEVDPNTLNKFYLDHGIFSYDLTDKANDDLTWGSVTRYNPNIVVEHIGGAGWPQSNFAQVEFRYKSQQTGHIITHFCKVADWSKKLIVDSYDGRVKPPGIYGNPVAYATFINNTPPPAAPAPGQRTVAVQPGWGLSNVAQAAGYGDAGTPARWAAIAALNGSGDWQNFNSNLKPGQQVIVSDAPAPSPAPAPEPSLPPQLYLPPSISEWHVYNPGGPWTLPYATHILSPSQFGGLTYDIVGSPAPHIFLINTQMFGQVAIYAGPDTVAQFPAGGHGEGVSDTVVANEVVPAPGDSPQSPKFTKLDEPLELIANKPATVQWDVNTEITKSTIPEGTPFMAVAKTTDKSRVYFLDDEGVKNGIGINSVDLSPISGSGQSEKVNVKVLPPTPNAWQRTYTAFMNPMEYVSRADLVVHDVAGEAADTQVVKGMRVTVAGKFEKDGVKYYRAKSSVDKNTWYGLPIEILEATKVNEDTELDDMYLEAMRPKTSLTRAQKATTAKIKTEGFFSRLMHRS